QANPTVITSVNHGLQTGRVITISGVSGSDPTINSRYSVTRLTTDTFSIPVNVLTSGTGGFFTTESNAFEDLQVCYNILVDLINSDPNVTFSNYSRITETTLQESVITEINPSSNEVFLNLELPWVLGPITVYNS